MPSSLSDPRGVNAADAMAAAYAGTPTRITDGVTRVLGGGGGHVVSRVLVGATPGAAQSVQFCDADAGGSDVEVARLLISASATPDTVLDVGAAFTRQLKVKFSAAVDVTIIWT